MNKVINPHYTPAAPSTNNINENNNGGATVSFTTLGCKLNQSETDAIATELQHRGFTIVSDSSTAKYTIINTCTVTAKADRKSRHSIYKAIRNALPNNDHTQKGIVLVTGCFVGSGMHALEDIAIDYVVENSKKKYIPDIIDSHEQGHIFDIQAQKPDYFGYTPSQSVFHTRQNLKIQDGCDNFCTFCIIPMVRGTAQSRPLEDIIQNARIMIEQGTKELVLTGVNMSRYAYQSFVFSDVLEGLLKLPGEFRVRISSLEPDTIDEKFYTLMSHPKMCPHLHLCLQSGSDRILMKMRRMYTTTEFLHCIEQLKTINNNINLTTDIIVGFPGETDHDFNESLNMIHTCEFSHTHIFPYSRREGTRASRIHHHEEVTIPVQKSRIAELEQLNIELKNKYRLAAKGSTQTLLVEHIHPHTNIATGVTEYYLPVEVHTAPNTSPLAQNTLVPVTITDHYTKKHEVLLHATMTD